MEEERSRMPATPHPAPAILVVDDDPAIRQLVAEVLANEGFAVTEAPDGIAALAALEDERFDAVISDVRMPRLDGPGLIRGLRRRGQRVPVALMSAVSADVALPGVPFVPKPFPVAHLLQTVWAMLATRP
jgi:two-component system response regulator MprA